MPPPTAAEGARCRTPSAVHRRPVATGVRRGNAGGREPGRPGRSSSRWPTPRPTMPAPPSTRPWRRKRTGPPPPPGSGARSCAGPIELLTERADELALLMTLEMGKPVAESAAEITYAAEFFRWFAEEAVRIEGRFSVNPAGKGRLLVMRQPVGPCLLITPWNFPMAMGTRKIGPAVAAGCTMVLKPAHQTPLSSLALAELLSEAGLPPGVLNVVTTSEAGQVVDPLLADSRLRKLSFTGSTKVGQSLAAKAADQLLRLSMELGGNAPFLVFGDADVDAAVEGAVIAKLRNGGEACTAANRFYVHDSVASAFTEQLVRTLCRHGRGGGHRPRQQGGAAHRPTPVAEGGRVGGRRRGARGPLPHRRPSSRRPRLLLPADGAGRRPARRPPAARGGIRSGGADRHLQRRGGGGRPGQ